MISTLLALGFLLAQVPVVRHFDPPGSSPAPVTCTLAASGDTCVLPISGAQWATVRITSVAYSGTGGLVWEQSLDGGANWLLNVYGKRVDAVSANPTMQAANAGVGIPTGQIFEVPLAGNATHIRVRQTSGSGSAVMRVSPGTPYVPGPLNAYGIRTPTVTAVLYDTTTSAGVANNTGVLDVSGWTSVTYLIQPNATASGEVIWVDDAGSLAMDNIFSGAGVSIYGGMGNGQTCGGTSPGVGVVVGMPRRIRAFTGSGAATGNRIRIEARR